MSAAALKRVKAFAESWLKWGGSGVIEWTASTNLNFADLRAVVALAEQAHDCDTCPVIADARAEIRELKRRAKSRRRR